jgi:hypothetical protein
VAQIKILALLEMVDNMCAHVGLNCSKIWVCYVAPLEQDEALGDIKVEKRADAISEENLILPAQAQTFCAKLSVVASRRDGGGVHGLDGERFSRRWRWWE